MGEFYKGWIYGFATFGVIWLFCKGWRAFWDGLIRKLDSAWDQINRLSSKIRDVDGAMGRIGQLASKVEALENLVQPRRDAE